MASAKIIGWLTFFTGILVIIFTLYSTYNIFTGKSATPEIIKFEKISQPPADQKVKIPTSANDIQNEISKALGDQVKSLIPSETIPAILNVTIFSILAGILIFGGSQIAGLGIKLLKD